MKIDIGSVFGASGSSGESRGWRVGHQGRDRMYYEELHDGAWRRIDIDGEMLTGRAHHVIYFASPDQWRSYPEWARDRRAEIVARVTSELREPDYEHYGLDAGAPPDPGSASAGPSSGDSPDGAASGAAIALPAVAPVRPPLPPPAGRPMRDPSGRSALLVVVLLLLAVAGAMGWLVARGAATGETYHASKRAYLRRTVSRESEAGLFWLSMSVYAVVGAGPLTLGALGARYLLTRRDGSA